MNENKRLMNAVQSYALEFGDLDSRSKIQAYSGAIAIKKELSRSVCQPDHDRVMMNGVDLVSTTVNNNQIDIEALEMLLDGEAKWMYFLYQQKKESEKQIEEQTQTE